jgi:hypothetical protein
VEIPETLFCYKFKRNTEGQLYVTNAKIAKVNKTLLSGLIIQNQKKMNENAKKGCDVAQCYSLTCAKPCIQLYPALPKKKGKVLSYNHKPGTSGSHL